VIVAPGAIVVSGVELPPTAATRCSPPAAAGAKMITPFRFHEPPAPFGASARTWGTPPFTSTFFSFPPAKNATCRESGDQNGRMAPSVAAMACDRAESVDQIHKR
jgi:hypothetical protein